MIRTIVLSAMLTVGAFAADVAHFLPLESGNEWNLRDSKTGAVLSIRVGTMTMFAGNVYHRLTGYVTQPVWVRFSDEGLVYRDEEQDADAPLTLFVPAGGAWFHAPFRICEQEGAASERLVGYTGPSGAFISALQIRYRAFDCGDAGVEEEIYQPSIGLLRRVEQSLAGPRQYDLVSARIGKLRLQTDKGGSFQVGVRPGMNPEVAFVATLLLMVDGELRVRKPVVQDYDVALKDETGQTIWRWSEGKVFPAALEERTLLGEATYTVEIPSKLNDRTLMPGKYVVEAWYTSGDDRTQFSAATAVEIAPQN